MSIVSLTKYVPNFGVVTIDPETRIVFETGDDNPNGYGWVAGQSTTPGTWRRQNCRWMGIAVFDTREDRAEAIEVLKWMGAKYWTEYQDLQGPGLSWSLKTGRF